MANSGELVVIKMRRNDVGQVIDGLNERRALYECTQRYWEQGGYIDSDDCPEIADCKDADEARKIAEHYREIVKTLETALASPHSSDCPFNIGQGCECGAGFARVARRNARGKKRRIGETTTITVRSSHGYFKVTSTGEILERVVECPKPCADGCLPWPIRFDLAEWREYWKQADLPEIDILDVGYWYGDGTQYEPAEMDWRKDCQKS